MKIIYYYFGALINTFFPLVSLPILTKNVSPDVYGGIATVAFVGYYFSLIVEGGVTNVLIHKIASSNSLLGRRFIYAAGKLFLTNWVCGLPFFCLLTYFLVGAPLLVIVGGVSALLPVASGNWYYYAKGYAGWFVVSVVISRLVSLLGMLSIAYFEANSDFLAFFWLASPVLVSLFMLIVFIRLGEGEIYKIGGGTPFKWVRLAYFHQVKGRFGASVYGSILALLVTFFEPPLIKGVYFFADRIRVGVQQLYLPISSFFVHFLSKNKLLGRVEKVVLRILLGFVVFALFGAIIMFAFSDYFVYFLADGQYLQAVGFLELMAGIMFFATLNNFVLSTIFPVLGDSVLASKIQLYCGLLGALFIAFVYFFAGVLSALVAVTAVEFFIVFFAGYKMFFYNSNFRGRV